MLTQSTAQDCSVVLVLPIQCTSGMKLGHRSGEAGTFLAELSRRLLESYVFSLGLSLALILNILAN